MVGGQRSERAVVASGRPTAGSVARRWFRRLPVPVAVGSALAGWIAVAAIAGAPAPGDAHEDTYRSGGLVLAVNHVARRPGDDEERSPATAGPRDPRGTVEPNRPHAHVDYPRGDSDLSVGSASAGENPALLPPVVGAAPARPRHDHAPSEAPAPPAHTPGPGVTSSQTRGP